MSDEYSSRRLPVYLVLDCSGSMTGEPIEAMQVGLKALLSDLRSDPQALETVWLSVITFSSTAQQLLPLTDIMEFAPPDLTAGGSTALGEAIGILSECIPEEVRKNTPDQKGDWTPLVFVMTDGEPTDAWKEAVEAFRLKGLGRIIACGAGPGVNDGTLRLLGDTVLRLKDTQPGTLGAFMKWVSTSVVAVSQALGARSMLSQLPEPGVSDSLSILAAGTAAPPDDGAPAANEGTPGAAVPGTAVDENQAP